MENSLLIILTFPLWESELLSPGSIPSWPGCVYVLINTRSLREVPVQIKPSARTFPTFKTPCLSCVKTQPLTIVFIFMKGFCFSKVSLACPYFVPLTEFKDLTPVYWSPFAARIVLSVLFTTTEYFTEKHQWCGNQNTLVSDQNLVFPPLLFSSFTFEDDMSPEANWAVEVLKVQVAKIHLVDWCNDRWFLFRLEVVRSVLV